MLPWDEEHCAWRGEHRHSGPGGCRIQVEAANRYAADMAKRWHRLNMAARKRARVTEPVVCAIAWEAQRRGAPHCHVVVIVNGPGERYSEALLELAPRYGFGVVHDRGYSVKGAYAHAAYLAKYVVKDGAREVARREAVFEASLLPRKALWVSPLLVRRSGATMAVSRHLRGLWAFAEGFRDSAPRYRDSIEAAWVSYWFRVGRKGRDKVPRSIVVRDYGDDPRWGLWSWPGELWDAPVLTPAAA